MDGAGDAGTGKNTEFATSSVLTDLSLAWLQDTGWCAPACLNCVITALLE